MNWWNDAVHRAIAEVVLAGALAGIVGVQVVLRRLSFFTMALTHATFPGVVAATLFGVDVLAGGIVAGAVVAFGVAALSRRPGQNGSAATGVLLSAGFALGAGLVATRSGFSQDLSALLVGSILTVSGPDLLATAVVLVVLTAVLVAFHRPLTFVGFDLVGARAAGFRTGAWDVVLLLATEVAVVTVVPAVGTILAVALIVAPAAAARQWSDRPSVITVLAVVFAVGGGLLGLYASARWNVAAGASIALTVTGILIVSSILQVTRGRFSLRPAGSGGAVSGQSSVGRVTGGHSAARSPVGARHFGHASGNGQGRHGRDSAARVPERGTRGAVAPGRAVRP